MAPCEIEQKFHPSSEKPFLKKAITVQGFIKREGQDADLLPPGVREVVSSENCTKVTFEDEGLPECVRFFDEDGNTLFFQHGCPESISIHEKRMGISWSSDGPKTEDGKPSSPILTVITHQ